MFKGKHTIYVIILFMLIAAGLLLLGRGITGFATLGTGSSSLNASQESFFIGGLMIIIFTILLFDFKKIFNKK